jgi:uncharacterized membrane protein
VERNTSALWFLAIILVIGAFLRFYDLGAESYWQDEVTLSTVVSSDFDYIIDQIQQGRPPVFTIIAYEWVTIFGTSETATRALTALLSVLALLIMYLVGTEIFGNRQIALLATFFMAFSARQIWHAQDFRYYALLILFSLLSYLCLVRALRDNRWLDWVLYVIFAALMFHTHVHGLFILVAQGLYFVLYWFIYKKQHIRWLISQVAILVLLSPTLLGIFNHIVPDVVAPVYRLLNMPQPGSTRDGAVGLVMDWIPQPTVSDLVRDVWRFLFYGYNLLSFAVFGIVFVIGMGVFIRSQGLQHWWKAVRRLPTQTGKLLKEQHSQITMVFLLFVLPLLLPFIGSFLLAPMYSLRYIIPAASGLYLLLGLAVWMLRAVIPVRLIVLAYLILALPTLVLNYYVSTTKDDWRGAGTYLSDVIHTDEALVIPTYNREYFTVADTFDWYYDGEVPVCAVKVELLNTENEFAQYESCVETAEAVWLVMYMSPYFITDLDAMEAFFQEQGWRRESEIGWYEVTLQRYVREGQ